MEARLKAGSLTSTISGPKTLRRAQMVNQAIIKEGAYSGPPLEFGRQTGFIAVATGIVRGATEEGVASRDLGKAEGPKGVVPASVGLAEWGQLSLLKIRCAVLVSLSGARIVLGKRLMDENHSSGRKQPWQLGPQTSFMVES